MRKGARRTKEGWEVREEMVRLVTRYIHVRAHPLPCLQSVLYRDLSDRLKRAHTHSGAQQSCTTNLWNAQTSNDLQMGVVCKFVVCVCVCVCACVCVCVMMMNKFIHQLLGRSSAS